MVRHFRNYGWLYLTLIVLIGWPVIVIRSQSTPPLDMATLRRLVVIYREGFARAHPQLHVEPMTEAPRFTSGLDAPYVARATGAQSVRVPAMPVLKPDIERLAKRDARQLALCDDLVARSIVYSSFLSEDSSATSATSQALLAPQDLLPSFVALQTLCKFRRIEAGLAIQEHRWDDALRLLESSARMGDPMRYEALVGHLIAVAMRAIAYAGYGELLQAGPPAQVERAALKSLAELRESEPTLDRWVLLGEKQYAIQTTLNQERRSAPRTAANRQAPTSLNDSFLRLFTMLDVAGRLVEQRDRIQDPGLRAQADGLAARYPTLAARTFFAGALLESNMKWTTVPTIRKWLVQTIAREPWVSRDPIIPESEYRNLDAWTLALLPGDPFAPLMESNWREINIRGRALVTQRMLLQEAFAARLFQEESGTWPSGPADIADLVPMSESLPTSSSASSSTTASSSEPFLPIRFAELEVTDQMRHTLWSALLPRVVLDTPNQQSDYRIGSDGRFGLAAPARGLPETERRRLSENGGIEWVIGSKDRWMSEWLKQPVLMVAVEEGLIAHPRLVEWAKAEAGYQRDVPAAAGEEFVDLRPLDPALARRITDESDRGQDKAAATASTATTKSETAASSGVGATTQPAQTSAGQPGETDAVQPAAEPPILALRLTAKLRAPEKVMVIWSPGPDGVDDGGAISYDPSNGTMSRGDLIVYPEKF